MERNISKSLKTGQSPDRVLLQKGRAVRDQELLSGGADLFGPAVFGKGGETALHDAELVDPFHPDQKVELPALLVAVQGA